MTPSHLDRLVALCDQVLIEQLRPALRSAIYDALSAGAPRAEILKRVPEGTMVRLQVEAYLDWLDSADLIDLARMED